MRKVLLVVLSAVLFGGCDMLASKKTEETKPNEIKEVVKEKAKISVGDTVVAKWSSGSFYEGKVESVDSTKIKVAWLDGSAASQVDTSDVYEIPAAGSKPDAKVGDMVLAKTGTGTVWSGAEITGIEGDVYKVQAVGSASAVNVSAEKMIKISSATAADFKDKASATDFLQEAQTRKPTVPQEFKPKKGDKVVGEWTTNSWYSGKIDNISGTKISVAWDDGSKPSAVDASKIIPLPTASDSNMPKENQFLLIKPASGSKWEFAKAGAVKGTSVEAKLSDGQTKTLNAGDFVLLN